MTPAEQARVFLAMMLCGAALGAAHTLLSVLCRGQAAASGADCLLGLLLAVGMVAVGLMMKVEPFRVYAFAGVAAGWLIYAYSVGTIVRILTDKMGRLSKKVKK